MQDHPSLNKLLTESDKPVLVDFYASWCEPCKVLSGELEQFAQTQGDKVKVIKVNIDGNTAAALHYQVRGVPTLVLFEDGKEIWRHSGVLKADEIEKEINKLLPA